MIITFLFLTFEHERLFENPLSVNRPFMKISYQNIFNNDFNNFNVFLANFNSFGDFKVCSKAHFSDILCRVGATHLTLSESQLIGFSMVRVFTERHLRVDFHFRLNVTVVSYMNSTSREIILHNFLQ